MKTNHSQGKLVIASISRSAIISVAFFLAWVSCSAMPGAAENPGRTETVVLPKSAAPAAPVLPAAGPQCEKAASGKECPHAAERAVTSPPKAPEQVALPEPPAMHIVPGLEEPLIAIGYVSEAETSDLKAATDEFRASPNKSGADADFSDYAKPLIAFIESHPKSAWNVAILTNLGLGYYHAGYFSKAFLSWQQAWEQGKNATSTQARLLVDRAVGELARMHARVGHAKELEALFTDIGNRPVGGPATELLQGAREGLHEFKTRPEISYLCGPRALENVLTVLKADKEQIETAQKALSGPKGISLAELDKLATKANLKHTLIRREPGQPIPVPSIVHWNVHHYAAILGIRDGFYEVRDPTFGSPSGALMTAKAIDAESSGYFLVPEKSPSAHVSTGWKIVNGNSSEAQAIFGMGVPTSDDPSATSSNDNSCGGTGGNTGGTTSGTAGFFGNQNINGGSGFGSGSGGPGGSPLGSVGGMSVAVSRGSSGSSGPAAVYAAKAMTTTCVKPMLVNLTLEDTPVGYRPAKGPSAQTTVTYNARESMQPANFTFSNMSAKWSFSWMSYVTDNPAVPGVSMQRNGPGGGAYKYVNSYNSTTGQFNYPESMDYSFMWRIPATGTLTKYEHRFPDGSKEVYSLVDGASTYPRKVFLTSIVDALGNTLTLNYDAQFRVTSITDAMGRSTTLSYGLGSYPLLVTSITDPFSRSATFTYDSSARLASITDPQGITSSFGYQAGEPSFVATLTTPYGTSKFSDRVNLYTYGYNALSRSLTLTDPMGYTEYYFRNANRTIIPSTDPAGVLPAGMSTGDNGHLEDRNTFYWDKHQFAQGVTTDACGVPILSDYSKATILHFLFAPNLSDAIGRPYSSIKQPLENRVWYNYQGQLSAIVGGTLDQPTYVGRVLDDGTTQLTAATYNATSGLPLTRTDPKGRITKFNYAANNIDITTVQQLTTSPSTYTTVATFGSYNSLHQPQTYTGPDGQTWNYTYTAFGQIKTVTEPSSNVTTWNYDASNRLSNIVNANSQTVLTLTYDSKDRVATRTDSQGYVLTYAYNNIDQVTSITYPDGTTDQFDYTFQSGPSAGNPTLDLRKYTDRLGRITIYNYDANRRLTSMVEPISAGVTRTTSYEYYENGALKNIIDANGNTTHWEIDLQSRPVSKTYAYGTASAKTETYTYENTISRLKTVTDALGQVKTFSYDKSNNVTGITYTNTVNSTPNVTFTYDQYFPRLSTMVDGTGTTTYSYGSIGSNGGLRPTSIAGPYTNDTLGLSYDSLGRLSGQTISGGNETFGYDAISRPTSHVTPLGTFTYGFLGQTNQIASRSVTNGGTTVSTTWGYDTNTNDRRLLTITNSGVSRSYTLGYGAGPVNPYDIMSITDTAAGGHPWATQSHNYTYDQSDRLLTASYTTPGNFSYAYDPLDNATTWTTPSGTVNPTYNVFNQISTWGALTYSYDNDGNLLSGDGVKTYKWDAENRLVEIGYVGSTAKTNFTYNGMGQRRVQVETAAGGGTTTTRYLWCGAAVCQTRDGSDNVLRRQTGEGEFNVSTGQKLVYLPDQLDAVRDVLDATTGTLVQSYDYAPYGAVTRSTGTAATDYQYAALFSHPASALSLAATRAYDSATGRWLNRDSIREAGGVNLYGYVGATPINGSDPSGLDWVYYQNSGIVAHYNMTFATPPNNMTMLSAPMSPMSTASGPNPDYVAQGYAGHGVGLNDRAYQYEPNVGPPPQGSYQCGPMYDNKRTGPGTMNLTPDPGTEMGPRDGSTFRIHGEKRGGKPYCASTGCIIVPRNVRNYINNSGDTRWIVVP